MIHFPRVGNADPGFLFVNNEFLTEGVSERICF